MGYTGAAIFEKFSLEEIKLRIRLSLLLNANSMKQVEDFMIDCWLAWERHPDYRKPDKSADGWLIRNVVLMAVFSHSPGKYDHVESYVVGSISTVMSQIEWATKKWKAEFSRIQPIVREVEIPTAMQWMKRFERQRYEEVVEMGGDDGADIYHEIRLHPYLITTMPYSYAGQGAEMTARLRLKELLPNHLKKWVSKARTGNAKPKHFYFSVEDIKRWSVFKNGRRIIKYPKHARQMKKWRLWFDKMVPLDDQIELMKLIPLEDFWNCATGKVHPNDVERYFVPPLFRGKGVYLGEIKPVSKQRKKRPAQTPQLIQLSLDI